MKIVRRKPSIDDKRIYRIIADELMPYSNYGDEPLRLKTVRERLRRGVTYVIRPEKGLCQGFIHVMKIDSTYWIDLLAIERRSQGAGYGAKLLGFAERMAKRNAAGVIYLFVDRSNQRAFGFYEKHGYRAVDYEQSIDCYKMEKSLQL